MNTKSIVASMISAAVLGGATIAPAGAQSLNDLIHHRQGTKNTWRNAAIGAGALGAYGFLSKKPTLGWVGLAGGLYSLSRYEHDRKSQSAMERRRAAYYHRSYIYHNGRRYHRTIVSRNGQRYYTYAPG